MSDGPGSVCFRWSRGLRCALGCDVGLACATAAVRALFVRPDRFSSPQWNVATRWEAVDAVRVELGADGSPGGECSDVAEPRTSWPESRR